MCIITVEPQPVFIQIPGDNPLIAGIIGATGYAGAELVRLLSGHQKINNLMLSSVSFKGDRIEDIYLNFQGVVSKQLVEAEEVIEKSDVVFSALPHAVGEQYAADCMQKNRHFIDLSADFRFDDDEKTYSEWYGKNYKYPQLHKKSIYGLPELNREKIKEMASKEKLIIGNPGCYPTGALLGIYPAAKEIAAVDSSPVIINAVTGISGGGREPVQSFHYCECADSVTPYKIASHRHSPEIERQFAFMSEPGANVPVSKIIFTPHLAPMNRGILSTIYIPLSDKWRTSTQKPATVEINNLVTRIHDHYSQFYKGEPFIRILPKGAVAATNRVRHSNYCDISLHVDMNGSTLIVITAIDNMIKGAAGQAIQNMNIIYDFDEKLGLELIPMVF